MEMKEHFSCIHFANALREAAEMARRAVTNPVEGTILTVSRETSEVAMHMAKGGASLKQTMSAIVAEAKKSVKKTPDLLPQLKEAGVVDAGGKGLMYVFQGMSEYVGKRVGRIKTASAITSNVKSKVENKNYGFDLQFLIKGNELPLSEMRDRIEKMGQSVIVVGDEKLIRVHIHTKTSDKVLDYARSKGEITDMVIENLDQQVKDFRNKINSVDVEN